MLVARRPIRRLVVTAVAAALLALAAAPASGAGTYDVIACDGMPVTASGWTSYAVGAMPGVTTDDCIDGGGFGGALLGHTVNPPGGRRGWIFTAPAGTLIDGLTLTRSLAVAGGTTAPAYEYGVYLYHPTPASGPNNFYGTAEHCTGSIDCTHLAALGQSMQWTATQPTYALIARVVCDAGDRGTCASATQPVAASFEITHADARLVDAEPPTLTAAPRGDLLSGRTLWGSQSFTVAAADVGGGVAQALVEVDGTVVATYPFDAPDGTCSVPYSVPVPCPLAATQTFAFDTASLPDGSHTLRLIVQDATDDNQVTAGPYLLVTSQRGLPNGSPAVASARLAAGLAAGLRGGAHHTLAVGFGARAVLRGRLLAAGGTPVAHARLLVSARRRGGGWQSLATVHTAANGRYALQLPAGPSRRLRVSYRTMTRDARPVAAAQTVLRVRAGVHASFPARVVRGRAATFAGRVLGSPLPRGGKLVEFQALQGASWVTFAVTHTDSSGRFSIRYTFAPGPSSRHKLRAYVPYEGDFGWDAGATRPQAIVVLAR